MRCERGCWLVSFTCVVERAAQRPAHVKRVARIVGIDVGVRRVLSDPSASVVIVEHRDRLARFGVEQLEAALSAQGRRIVVADKGETEDDLVRDMLEVLTSMCARLYGRRGARNRAMRAVTATKAETGAA